MSTTPITNHEGKKYLRVIYSALDGDTSIEVDVYEILEAFPQPDHPSGHAIKKLLCAGDRGKGTRLQDLIGAMAALNRAIELEQRRVRRDANRKRTAKTNKDKSVV